MATFYVKTYATGGRDEIGRNGSVGQEWATLSYAINRVTTPTDIIHINTGSYSESGQMLLSNGVSIEGDGRSLVTITLTYNASYPCIKAESSGQWGNPSYGNQHISGIKFVGSTTPGTPIGHTGIGINYRSNVEIYDCEFVDFVRTAVCFAGEPTWNMSTIVNPYNNISDVDWEYLPNTNGFCTGNKFYNNIVTNCAHLISGTDYSGALCIGTQNGILIYGNTITCKSATDRNAGMPIKFWDVGFNRNVKIYNNTLDAGRQGTNYWAFAIELWFDLGGQEIYNNNITGCIDFCDSWDQYGVGYGSRIYDNDIGQLSLGSISLLDRAIHFEGAHIDSYVFRNYIHHVARAISFNNANSHGLEYYNNVHIYDNVMVELGQTYGSWQCWGLQWSNSVVSAPLFQNIYIQHNTIVASESNISPTTYGIMIPTVSHLNGFYVENNIIINFERGAIFGIGARTQLTNVRLRNNLIYDCYNSNEDVTYDGSFTPTTGISYSGTVKASPSFLGSGDDPYQLSSTSSPAYHAGRDLDIATDYAGNLFHATTPSIGAYELNATPPISLLEGLKAWWKGTERSGSTIYDSTVNIYHGTVVGNPTLGTEGIIDYAIEFDGIDDVINCAASVGDMAYSDISISCWVYLVSSVNTYNGILGNWGSDPYVYANFDDTDRFRVRIGISGSEYAVILSNSPANTGTWYHFVFRLDRDGNMDMYINNVKQTDTVNISAYSGIDLSNSNNFNLGNIGSALSGYFGKIKLCHVGLYNRLLTETEIGLLYNSGNALDYPFAGGAKGSVPDTTTFALSDVIDCVEPSSNSLGESFVDSIDGLFDVAYKGSKDRLSNFRNYNG
jgi:hypothetical protein